MTPHRRLARAAARTPDPPQPVLRFCAVCHVSVAQEEIEAGTARRTRAGHLWCGVCVAATPEERAQRRADLEAEFADDAPIPVAAPVARKAAAVTPPPPARPVAPRPPMTASEVDVVLLDRRAGELERAVFRLQARVQYLEERLAELERRGG